MNPKGIRLDDEQVRRFICDGVVVLDSGVAPEVNQRIYNRIQWSNTHEFNMGNNVLPRVAELQQVLDAPAVRGALQSVLGDGYLLHPHRFMHASEPLDEEERNLSLAGDEHRPPMGKRSTANSGWHRDGQIPLGRARYHVPRAVLIFYFPQDTPVERGPTRVIPGTHLQSCLQEGDYPFAFVPHDIKAGSFLLVASDIAHAGLSNRTDLSRYMFKFVFLRTRNPTGPSWDGGEVEWRPPKERLGRYDHSRAWSYIWDWMRAAPRFAARRPVASIDAQKWIAALNGTDQAARLEAIYGLAAMGAEAISPLRESLLQYAGLQRELKAPGHIGQGAEHARDGDPDVHRWNEWACVPQDEAYAMGAMGGVAVEPLTDLLRHDDAWIKINAAFALGEIGAPAAGAIPDLVELLEHERHQVARAGLDAMAYIGVNTRAALPAIRKVLTVKHPTWQSLDGERWTGENQARFNAMCALLNSDIPVEELDDLMIHCLDDDTAYVHALALEALTRPRRGEDRPGLRHSLHYLKAHRWDHMLAHGKLIF